MRLAPRRFSCGFLPALSARPWARGTVPARDNSLPRFNLLFRLEAAVSSPGPGPACMAGNGILTVSPSGTPLGSPLGPDLP